MTGGRTAAIAALALALAAGACRGDGEAAAGKLGWSGEPRVLRHPTLPSDRILRGTVRNESLRAVALDAVDVRLLDAAGREIPASAVFLEAYVKPLESRNRPSQETEGERRRRGLEAKIEAGQSAPITIAWRQPAGVAPARVDYGQGSLPLP